MDERFIALKATRLTPIAKTLHLRLEPSNSTVSPTSTTYANLPRDLRSVCLNWREINNEFCWLLRILPKDLRSLCLHVQVDKFCSTKFFTILARHLPKLQTLELAESQIDRSGHRHSFNGKPILQYLHGAKHLKELKLYSVGFNHIELNDFYEKVLEIIAEREDKLPLTIYHRGDAIVRNNNLLKFFNTNFGGSQLCRRYRL